MSSQTAIGGPIMREEKNVSIRPAAVTCAPRRSPSTRMAEVFISYATEDRPRAKALAETLELRGWSVWWDKKIPLGQSFDTVIEDAIAAANCVVVLWTRSSVRSEWVRSEASEGKRRGILVPVFLEQVDAPLAFRLLNGADLSAWEAGIPHPELDTLTERIAEILKQPGTREPQVVDVHGNNRTGTHDTRYRRPWLIAGAAILLTVGVFYAAYIAGSWRQPAAATPLSSGGSTSAASESQALEDLLKPLGLGLGGDATLAMRAFELQDIGLHLVFVRPEQADAFGLSPGAVVLRVEKGAGQTAGVQAGDVVAAINGRKISSENDLRNVPEGNRARQVPLRDSPRQRDAHPRHRLPNLHGVVAASMPQAIGHARRPDASAGTRRFLRRHRRGPCSTPSFQTSDRRRRPAAARPAGRRPLCRRESSPRCERG